MQLIQPVLGDQIPIIGVEPGNQPSQWGDAVALPNSQHAGIDMGRSGLQGRKAVGDGAAAVVVSVKLDVGLDAFLQLRYQDIELTGGGHAHGVGQSDPVHAEFVHSLVDPEQILFLASKSVFAGKPDLAARLLDKVDHHSSACDDLVDCLAMAETAQVGGGSEEDVHPVHPRGHRLARIVHVAARVGQDLAVQAQAGNGLAVFKGLGRSRR